MPLYLKCLSLKRDQNHVTFILLLALRVHVTPLLRVSASPHLPLRLPALAVQVCGEHRLLLRSDVFQGPRYSG